MNYLILIIVAVIGIALGAYFAQRKDGGLIVEQVKRKRENKRKISELLKDKEKVTNNEVESLLGVSNATAERYLNELEKEGKIKQRGKTGRSVFYTLN